MSTILDALSRAERERHMGQMPIIERALLERAGSATVHSSRRRLWPWLAVAAAMVVLLMAALVLLLHERPAASGPSAASAGAATVASADATQEARAEAAQQAIARPGPATQAPATQAPAGPPAERATSPVSDTGSDVFAVDRQAASGAVAAAKPKAAGKPSAAHGVPERSAKPHVARSHPGVQRPQQVAKEEASAPIKQSEPQAVAGKAQPAKTVLPMLAELPAATRQQLPPIQLGGYIYSANAADRSILINGKLLREGEQVTPDLRLEQMRPDGVVLAYKDLRFRMGY